MHVGRIRLALNVNEEFSFRVDGCSLMWVLSPAGQAVPRYDALIPDVAQHNSSNCNALSQHMHFRIDRRIRAEKLRDGFW